MEQTMRQGSGKGKRSDGRKGERRSSLAINFVQHQLNAKDAL